MIDSRNFANLTLLTSAGPGAAPCAAARPRKQDERRVAGLPPRRSKRQWYLTPRVDVSRVSRSHVSAPPDRRQAGQSPPERGRRTAASGLRRCLRHRRRKTRQPARRRPPPRSSGARRRARRAPTRRTPAVRGRHRKRRQKSTDGMLESQRRGVAMSRSQLQVLLNASRLLHWRQRGDHLRQKVPEPS